MPTILIMFYCIQILIDQVIWLIIMEIIDKSFFGSALMLILILITYQLNFKTQNYVCQNNWRYF